MVDQHLPCGLKVPFLSEESGGFEESDETASVPCQKGLSEKNLCGHPFHNVVRHLEWQCEPVSGKEGLSGHTLTCLPDETIYWTNNKAFKDILWCVDWSCAPLPLSGHTNFLKLVSYKSSLWTLITKCEKANLQCNLNVFYPMMWLGCSDGQSQAKPKSCSFLSAMRDKKRRGVAGQQHHWFYRPVFKEKRAK